MPQATIAQLRLRRAFRYGYGLFLLLALLLLACGAVAAFEGDLMSIARQLLSGGFTTLLTALFVVLAMPLFLGIWFLIGTAMLGSRRDAPVVARHPGAN